MGTGIIIAMACLTVGSAVAQGILSSLGKQTESQYLDLATKSGLVITALGVFAQAIKAISSLG